MQLVWFRNDLRTQDHEALSAAFSQGPTVGVFLWAGAQWRSHNVGEPRLAFLRRSLKALQNELKELNVPLLILNCSRFSEAPAVLVRLAQALKADAIHATEEFPLNERVRDSKARNACEAANIDFALCGGGTILPPAAVLKDDGDPYSVFTPFKRRWARALDQNARTTTRRPQPQADAPSVSQRSLSELGVVTDACLDLSKSFDGVDASRYRERWPGGADEAERRMRNFLRSHVERYQERRDLPAEDGTSTLSPYLSIGAISARRCLANALSANSDQLFEGNEGISTWISELTWRDFYRHVVVHFPQVNKHRAFKADTEAVPWRDDQKDLEAWQQGRTGYPLVDAAMRQLNATGWMHNRLRMVAAMFLSKHLLLDWRLGERYFMEQLVDGDFAANNGGWQWSASTGTDAAPYFRIFNPTSQAERYDADGRFVLQEIPELTPLEKHLARKKKYFFEPWTAPDKPDSYPEPIVDHKAARERALAAFKGR